MCYRTKLNAKISAIEKTFDAQFTEPEMYFPQVEINGFDFSKTPVIADHAPGEILLFNWGLIPHWAKNDQIKKSTLNAKIETVRDKPAFRDSIENRCLVIANGYYEWQWRDEKGKQKLKYLITSKEAPIFAFAGFYSVWQHPETEETISSYSILTTEANELMSEIHNTKKRMPVLLRPQDHRAWLEGKEVNNFAFPYESHLKAQLV